MTERDTDYKQLPCEEGQFSIVKRCPLCMATKPLTTEFWYARRVMRTVEGAREKVWRASVYCRDCTNVKRREQKMLQKKIRQLPEEDQQTMRDQLRGPCDCCGKKQCDRRVRNSRGIYCRLCCDLLSACDHDLEEAKAMWISLCVHITAERQLDDEWAMLHDRRRDQHEGLPHVQCLWMELAWRHVVTYLGAI